MTKKLFVFVACLAVALSFTGCAADRDGGSASKGSSIASLDSDPMADGLAVGYVSTLAADWSGNPSHNVQVSVDNGLTPMTRPVFLSNPTRGLAADGQVAVSTLAPATVTRDFDPTATIAVREASGLVRIENGDQVSYLQSVERNNVSYTFAMGADGRATLTDENTYPRIVGEGGSGQGVAMLDGSVVLIQE
jgi:hypothetical protein